MRRRRRRVIKLLDRQERNVLNHLLEILVPSDETFGAVRFIVGMEPSLVFQRDAWGKTPLEGVLDRLMSAADTTTRGNYMSTYGGGGDFNEQEGPLRNYRMLKLLVKCMEEASSEYNNTLEEEGGVVRGEEGTRSMNGSDPTRRSDDAEEGGRRRNALQSACLLPRRACPPDGSLVAYLSSAEASVLEARDRIGGAAAADIVVNMAAEEDGNGRRALHLFVSNESHAMTNSDDGGGSGGGEATANATTRTRTRRRKKPACDAGVGEEGAMAEQKMIRALLDRDRDAVRVPDGGGMLPLRIAMGAGRRRAVSLLLPEYPGAVLLDDDVMGDVRLFANVLSCVSVPEGVCPNGGGDRGGGGAGAGEDLAKDRLRCLTTMFKLVRSRPDVVCLAGNGSGEPEPGQLDRKAGGASKMKRLWKKVFG